jgi:hypothetical protein
MINFFNKQYLNYSSDEIEQICKRTGLAVERSKVNKFIWRVKDVNITFHFDDDYRVSQIGTTDPRYSFCEVRVGESIGKLKSEGLLFSWNESENFYTLTSDLNFIFQTDDNDDEDEVVFWIGLSR